jgi:2-keto-4-pentenoate hydratase/2-oxohepta-3-ene-1,7-dioic acid hydratase in catechol pathway
MRVANVGKRLSLVVDGGIVDAEKASDGQFDAAPELVYARWDEFTRWARSATLPAPEPLTSTALLGPPSPKPSQVIAIGLNYQEHAAESGFAKPDAYPPVFTKFVSSLAGPYGEVRLPEGGHTDWEVELVAVIGRTAFQVDPASAWEHVAGLTVGQDLSERILQLAAAPPQFSLGKSYPGFAPTGPWLVTVDEFDDPGDLALGCSVNGEPVQDGRTRDLIFPVPELVAQLSAVMPLLPGDIIFTGTPSGVGMGRSPQRFLSAGDELVSYVAGIGELRQRFIR